MVHGETVCYKLGRLNGVGKGIMLIIFYKILILVCQYLHQTFAFSFTLKTDSLNAIFCSHGRCRALWLPGRAQTRNK